MPITALYAGLLAPLFILLSIRVIDVRRTARISIGHGDDPELLRRMRVHANFAEYVPFVLISLALAESLGTSAYILHAVGLIFIFGRYVHAFGLSQTPQIMLLRVTGMIATLTAIGAVGLACLFEAIARLI